MCEIKNHYLALALVCSSFALALAYLQILIRSFRK